MLEPFTFTTIVATATEQAWRWFFGLRDSEQADPKFAVPARMMHEAYKASKPRPLRDGDWHLPYIGDADIAAVRRDYGFCDVPHLDDLSATDRTEVQQTLAKMSAARCPRISYLRQHEERELSDELLRHHELVRMRHWSPTEHQARANSLSVGGRGGNLGAGWDQHRHIIGDGYAESGGPYSVTIGTATDETSHG